MEKPEYLTNAPKLHFIHCLEYNNVGDWCASPLNYFTDYFLSRYCVMYHHINTIQWSSIAPCDAIILGGGGMLDNFPSWQEAINKMFEACGCVIAWGVGFHNLSNHAPPEPKIDYSKFALISVRDYEYPVKLEYLPCVTCMLPQLQKTREIRRSVGVINHQTYTISGTGYDTIDNSYNIDEITDFIAESEAILTTSYHAAYWALLMGKKTIVGCVWANKFEYFERKPVILEELSIDAVNEALMAWDTEEYNGWLDECISLNIKFFERVKDLLGGYMPISDNNVERTIMELLRQQAWAPLPAFKQMGDIVEQVNIVVEEISQKLVQIEQRLDTLEREVKH